MSGRIVALSRVRSFHTLLRAAMAALLLVSSAATTSAQSTSATILGTLTDSSGARIAGGSIAVKDLGTGIEQKAVSDAQGEYVIPDLKAVHYSNIFSTNSFRHNVMSD